jgi:hypothetical protein
VIGNERARECGVFTMRNPVILSNPVAGTEVQDCSMRSLEMCRNEVIAGNRGSCYPNPRSPDAGENVS